MKQLRLSAVILMLCVIAQEGVHGLPVECWKKKAVQGACDDPVDDQCHSGCDPNNPTVAPNCTGSRKEPAGRPIFLVENTGLAPPFGNGWGASEITQFAEKCHKFTQCISNLQSNTECTAVQLPSGTRHLCQSATGFSCANCDLGTQVSYSSTFSWDVGKRGPCNKNPPGEPSGGA